GTYEQSEAIITLFKKLQAETSKGIIICWLGVAESVRIRGADAGLTVYGDPARFLQPLSNYFRLQTGSMSASAEPSNHRTDESEQHDITALLKEAGLDDNAHKMSEKQSMICLERFGVDL